MKINDWIKKKIGVPYEKIKLWVRKRLIIYLDNCPYKGYSIGRNKSRMRLRMKSNDWIEKKTGVPYEKTKLWVRKSIHALAILLFLLYPFLSACNTIGPERPELQLVDDALIVEDYYSSLNELYCRLELTFNQNVHSGYARVSFYDPDGHYLETAKVYLTYDSKSFDKELLSGNCYVRGEVDSYVIDRYDVEADYGSDVLVWFLWGSLLFFFLLFTPIWIRTFTESYREYQYKGQNIAIYCGHFHYYIKINGVKYDEVIKLFSFCTFGLSCKLDNGEQVVVRITPAMKRVQLKIDDRLIPPC